MGNRQAWRFGLAAYSRPDYAGQRPVWGGMIVASCFHVSRRSAMSDNLRPDNATVNELALPQVREVRRRFEAAWEETLRNGSQPPDPDSFLGDIGAADL